LRDQIIACLSEDPAGRPDIEDLRVVLR
jgi:hypothetical protein